MKGNKARAGRTDFRRRTRIRAGRLAMPISMFCALMLVIGLAACVHAPPLTTGGATVYGHLTVRVLENLDYFLPAQTRSGNVLISLLLENAGKRGDVLQTASDQSGYFYRTGLHPGAYRVTVIRAPGRYDDQGRPMVDVIFPLWERSLGVGFEGLEATPLAQGSMPDAKFTLEAGETRYLGDYELSFRHDPFPEQEGCLTRTLLLPGLEGEAYLSSTPIGARLCVTHKEDEARAWLAKHHP